MIDISNADFTLIDSKTGAPTKLEYESFRKMNQKGMATGWKIALVAIAGFVVVVVVATKTWQSEYRNREGRQTCSGQGFGYVHVLC